MLLTPLGRASTAAWGLAALLFWAPLPAGSVTPASELVFRLAAFVLLAVALAAHRERWDRASVLPVAALAAVGLLGAVQSLPWPAGAAAIVSPEHVRLHDAAAALLDAPAPRFVPLSLDAAVSRSSAIAWLAAAALLAVALTAGRRARPRRWFLGALVAAAVVQVGVGLVRLEQAHPAGLGAVLLRPEGRLRGTYANPNALSFLLEMCLVAVAAWSWLALARAGSGRRRSGALLPLGLWLGLFTGIVLTGSRAGLAAALFATIVQGMALVATERRRRAGLAVALVVLLALAALVGGGSRLGVRRYEGVSLFEDNLRSRLQVVAPALEIWREFPWSGTGLGTFEDAFPLRAPAELSTDLWNRAHNDPLELLLTGGVVGLALACLAALALLRPIWRATRDGACAEDRAAGLAALGAFAAAGLHELTDFGLVFPANGLALLVILGSAAAAGLSRARRVPE